MYVCICNAVTEKEVEKAIHEGAETVQQLRERLQVAACCGTCTDSIEQCLAGDRLSGGGISGEDKHAAPAKRYLDHKFNLKPGGATHVIRE